MKAASRTLEAYWSHVQPLSRWSPSSKRINMPSKLSWYLRQGGFVFVGVCLFVCCGDYVKIRKPIFTKFDRKVAHGARKKVLDFGGNPDHVTPGLGCGLRYGLGDWVYIMHHRIDRVIPPRHQYSGYDLAPPYRMFHPRRLFNNILRDQRPWRKYALYWVPF